MWESRSAIVCAALLAFTVPSCKKAGAPEDLDLADLTMAPSPDGPAAVDLRTDPSPDLLMPLAILDFAPMANYPAGTEPFSVAIADFDRDGKLDIAVANSLDHNVAVLRNLGGGIFPMDGGAK